jgi:diguanylate cyclase (GGDEF)-like protein
MTSVRTRILFFFTLFATVSLFALFMSGRSIEGIGQAANNVVNRHLPMVYALRGMESALQREESATFHYVLTGDKKWRDEWEKARINYNRQFVDAQAWASEQVEKDLLQSIDELYIQYENQTKQVLMSTTGASRPKMLAQNDDYLNGIQSLLDQLIGLRQGMTIVHQTYIRDTLDRYRGIAYGFLVSIVLFFLALAFYLWRFLVRPLDLLLNGIRNFTRGKTDIQMPSIGKDELGELQDAFNEMSREISVERKRLRAESQSDALTGLFNMRYFKMQVVEEFSRSQRYGRPLTLLMIDVDFFKSYNDRNGHPAGDIVLKEVSRIMIRNVRGTDIVARYGGEEFVVLLPETPMSAALSVAEKIRKAVEDHHFPFRETHVAEKLTVSIGVASYPDMHITSDQDLIESADKALYTAKKSGRNRVCCFFKGQTRPAADVAVSAALPHQILK